MFTSAYDQKQQLFVGVWSGTSNSVADYDLGTRQMQDVYHNARGFKDGVVTIIVVEPENPRPSPLERKRLTEMMQSASIVPKHFFSLVTANVLTRGVLTAVNWFVPTNDRRVNATHATFDKAADWANQLRPGTAARLNELHREARAAIPRTTKDPVRASY